MAGEELIKDVKEIYHKLIRREYSKYEQSKTIKSVSLQTKDFDELGIHPDFLEYLVDNGYLIKLGDGEYRTLLMDVVFRSADVRVKYGGTKYVLESELKLKVRPILRHDYIKFEREDKELRELKESITRKLGNSKLTENFLMALSRSGVIGLSKYQYQSIISILNSDKDVVVSAPTAFGKTYTFVIPMLVECLKADIEGANGSTAVIFYPRKSLGSDQMGKLIKLVDNINTCCGTKITIGIDEGDTKKRAEIRDGEIFRGIKCPHHDEQTLSFLDKRVYCPKGHHYLDFINSSKDSFKTNPPSIVITNIYSYPYRLSNTANWTNGYLNKDIKFFIFDEIHAYRGIVAGMLKYFIGILRSLVAPNARVVLSSATIPHLEDFVTEITSKKLDNMLDLVYKESRYGRDSEKLELYLLVGINPYTSWETYTHELAIYLSSVNRLRENKNLQSLIFIDSVKNINRVYGQAREAIKLGDPKDHFNSAIDVRHPYSYWAYNDKFKVNPEEIDTSKELLELRKEIDSNLSYHYSQRPDRFEIEEKIKKGNIDVVFTTSTLELGVDYDNVSVVVNAGIPFSLESIVQRVGRAGRKESTTLNTSLSIVVVKNNPLQYFYLYKGIDFLIDPDMMQKIPVSFNNQFVILYSSMLYSVATFAKQGGDVKGNVNTLRSIIDYIDKNETRIRAELGMRVDFSKIRENTKKIIEILGRDDIDDKCKEVQSYLNSLWLKDSLLEIDQDIGRIVEMVESSMERVATREREHFQKHLSSIKDLRKHILDETIELDELEVILCNLQNEVDQTKNMIRSQQHPLIESKKELQDLSQSLFDAAEGAGKTTATKGKLTKEQYGIFSRACEIHKSMSDHIIKLIETLVGVKFMGTQFMDQLIFIKPMHQSGNGEEEFLTNVVERIPPFELANVPFESKEARELTNAVGARHVWFPKPKYRYILTPDAVPRLITNLDTNGLSGGVASKMGSLMVPESIELIDVSALDKPLIIRVGTRQGPPLYIKYGSDSFSGSKVRGQYPIPRNIRSMYQEWKLKNYNLVKEATLAEIELMDERIINQDNNRWGLHK
ncbi:MAG: DEAD/DEAH box helicase [Methanomassiliicoccales archaeon]|nr:MAG: DEAD/DEAH box helicase [Methanomassiliicoccales archaeon]